MSEKIRVVRILLLISIACFVTCLPLHAFSTQHASDVDGWSTLFFGWLELLATPRVSGLARLSWFVNPILLFTWIALGLRSYRIASLFGAIAAWVSLSFLLVQNVTMDGTVTDTVTSYGPGYWFWVASTLAAFVGALIGRLKEAAQLPRQAYITKWRQDAGLMILMIVLGMYSTYGPASKQPIQDDLGVDSNAVRDVDDSKASPELKARGKNLRIDVDNTFQAMNKAAGSPNENSYDLKDLCSKYIPAGTSFTDLEIILRAAGMHSNLQSAKTLSMDTDMKKGEFTVEILLHEMLPRTTFYLYVRPESPNSANKKVGAIPKCEVFSIYL